MAGWNERQLITIEQMTERFPITSGYFAKVRDECERLGFSSEQINLEKVNKLFRIAKFMELLFGLSEQIAILASMENVSEYIDRRLSQMENGQRLINFYPKPNSTNIIHLLAWRGDVSALEKLLNRVTNGPETPFHLSYFTEAGAKGVTPLHYAALAGDVNTLRFFLDNHQGLFDPRKMLQRVDYGGRTIFHYAAMSGNIEAVRYLFEYSLSLQMSTDIGFMGTDNYGASPLFYAAMGGSPEVFDFIANKKDFASVFSVDSQGRNALHYAAQGGSLDMVRHIENIAKQHGTSLWHKDQKGRLPIFDAVNGGNPAIVDHFVPLATLAEDVSVLSSSDKRKRKIGQKILASRDKGGFSLPDTAALNGDYNMLQHLVKNRHVNVHHSYNGIYVTDFAMRAGSVPCVKFLFEEAAAYKVNPETKRKYALGRLQLTADHLMAHRKSISQIKAFSPDMQTYLIQWWDVKGNLTPEKEVELLCKAFANKDKDDFDAEVFNRAVDLKDQIYTAVIRQTNTLGSTQEKLAYLKALIACDQSGKPENMLSAIFHQHRGGKRIFGNHYQTKTVEKIKAKIAKLKAMHFNAQDPLQANENRLERSLQHPDQQQALISEQAPSAQPQIFAQDQPLQTVQPLPKSLDEMRVILQASPNEPAPVVGIQMIYSQGASVSPAGSVIEPVSSVGTSSSVAESNADKQRLGYSSIAELASHTRRLSSYRRSSLGGGRLI